eukprot:TRINITY_DN10238_c0_g1_i1.p1 TRINITY_DN10238_c0_g1~~TRINITY_DN10238_c0_g1_i1.p1  ORF type:complete len:433 (+),score=81.54 TRINITY_DN10238_c0_g1_i1:27-1325(+)
MKKETHATHKGNSDIKEGRGVISKLNNYIGSYDNFITFFILAFIGELVLNYLIVTKISYTEIDWIAYMQEVKGVIDGDYNYSNLRGDTGPLVYPGGFVWIYTILYYVTSEGTNILLGQYIFIGLYMVFMTILFLLYKQANVGPAWIILLLCVSRRIHSIFVLRLFNDCFAMIFLYFSLLLFCKKKWWLGSFFYSFALSIKMNILLYAPAVGLMLVKQFGFVKTVPHLMFMALIQIVAGLPFLLTFPKEYFNGAFNFSRQFMYKWTVNLKFLPEETFLSKELATGLLVGNLLVLLIFAWFKWCKSENGIFNVIISKLPYNNKSSTLSPSHIVAVCFSCNFVGIIFARSLHYQFYVWYYHTLPLLLWLTPYPTIVRLILLGLIEFVWNIYPMTSYGSLILVFCHFVILIGLWMGKVPSTIENDKHLDRYVSKNK